MNLQRAQPCSVRGHSCMVLFQNDTPQQRTPALCPVTHSRTQHTWMCNGVIGDRHPPQMQWHVLDMSVYSAQNPAAASFQKYRTSITLLLLTVCNRQSQAHSCNDTRQGHPAHNRSKERAQQGGPTAGRPSSPRRPLSRAPAAPACMRRWRARGGSGPAPARHRAQALRRKPAMHTCRARSP